MDKLLNKFSGIMLLLSLSLLLPFYSGLDVSTDSSITKSSATPNSVDEFTITNVSFSSYIGGSQDELSETGFILPIIDVTLDNSDNPIIVARTSSTDFPIKNAIQNSSGGEVDVVLIKFSSEGELLFSTYFGGSGDDWGTGVRVDSENNIIITGTTASTDFPTKNPLYSPTGVDTDLDCFVAKFSSDGQELLFSTFYGGSLLDWSYGVALDSEDNIAITGSTYSTDLPLNHSFDSSHSSGGVDAFITMFNSEGDSLLFSSYYGGSGHDWGYGLGFDSTNNLVISGGISSTELTFSENNIQDEVAGSFDILVLKINSDYSLNFSLCVGGKGEDWGNGLVINSQDNIIFTGKTSSDKYPTEQYFQKDRGGDHDAFLTIIDPLGKDIITSTFLGGSEDDIAYELSLDNTDRIYLVGETKSEDFPLENSYQESLIANKDAFLTVFNKEGTDICFSSFIGGNNYDAGRSVGITSTNEVVVLGFTKSSDFTVKNAYQSELNGYYDLFVIDVDPELSCGSSSNSTQWLDIESFFYWVISLGLISICFTSFSRRRINRVK